MSTGSVKPENVLPDWAQWVQALGPVSVSLVTAIVAVAVGVIAYRQWRTAREKLALDLFDKRMTIYIAAKAGIDEFTRDGHARNNSIRNIAVVRNEAQFLFSNEIETYLAKLQEALARVNLAFSMAEQHDQSQDWAKVIFDTTMFINGFYDEFPKLLAPYMRMTQKVG